MIIGIVVGFFFFYFVEVNFYVCYLWLSNNKILFYFYYVLFVLIYGEYVIYWNKFWYDNVCVREINIWLWSEVMRVNVKFEVKDIISWYISKLGLFILFIFCV